MVVAVLFSLSVLAAAFLVYNSSMSALWRMTLIPMIGVFALIAYVFATRSGISPFGTSGVLSFGDSGQWFPTILAVVGAITGVIGSYFFSLGAQAINWRNFVPPLATAPIVLIPTIKLVEASNEQTPVAMILLFALSYQNGFFWERLLKRAPQ